MLYYIQCNSPIIQFRESTNIVVLLHHNHDTEHFHHPPAQFPLCPFAGSTLPLPSFPGNYWSGYRAYGFAFPECRRHGITQHAAFCVWLPSLAVMHLIHPCCCRYQRFIPFYYLVLFRQMNIPQFTCTLTSWRTLGLFWEIMNGAAIHVEVQLLVWTDVFTSLGQIPVSHPHILPVNFLNVVKLPWASFHSCSPAAEWDSDSSLA